MTWDTDDSEYQQRILIGILEGSLEAKLPTIWTDGKAEAGRVREKKRRREKIRGERVLGYDDTMPVSEKGGASLRF